MSIYRKLYKLFYGTIPKDEQGRSYEIHHIDGDRTNNHILNLVAITIQDHYDVHYYQGDFAACIKIAQKMKLSPEKISELVSKQQKERVKNGIHHFLGGEIQKEQQRKLIGNGKHHFQNSEYQSKMNRLKTKLGTNPWAGKKGSERSKKLQRKRISEGEHHFIGEKNPVYKQIKEGKHPLAIYAKNAQKRMECPVCKKVMNEGNYIRWNHGQTCNKVPMIQNV